MKRLLIITNTIWLLIFVFVFFRYCKSGKTEDCKTISSNYSRETERKGRLSLVEAKTMADLYFKNHFPVPNGNINAYSGDVGNKEVDARSVWFSLETLKQFLWDIESESATCKSGCQTLNLGVRIYYAEYPVPTDPTDKAFPADEKKKHTIFMVPTYSKEGSDRNPRDYDFNPRVISYGKIGSPCAPITLQELIKVRDEEKAAAQNSNTLKFTFAQFTPSLKLLLEDRFILSPHPESLVKTIAAENMPPMEENGKPKDPKGDGKTPKDTNKKQPKRVAFNAFAPPQGGSGDYMFQNHGSLCPAYCNDGEDSFAH